NILWLGADQGELAAHIAADPGFVPNDGRSGYLRCPTAFYRVGSGHTWRTVARVLNVPFDELFDRTYQIERSAAAAREARRGVAPTNGRTAFVADLARLLTRTASLLVLHGRMGGDAGWDNANNGIAAAFLGLEGRPSWTYQRVGSLSAVVSSVNG